MKLSQRRFVGAHGYAPLFFSLRLFAQSETFRLRLSVESFVFLNSILCRVILAPIRHPVFNKTPDGESVKHLDGNNGNPSDGSTGKRCGSSGRENRAFLSEVDRPDVSDFAEFYRM